MAVQTNYNAPQIGLAGRLVDATGKKSDSRTNEAEDGAIQPGFGVVQGSVPGTNVVMPDGSATAETYEGVVMSGGSVEQQFITGKAVIYNGTTLDVLRSGRVWVQVPEDEDAPYGALVKLITSGDDIGKFSTEGDVALNATFLGRKENGVAAAEFYEPATPSA